MKENEKLKVAQELAKAMIQVIEKDAPNSLKRKTINKLIEGCVQTIGQQYLYKGFDAVCDHFGDPNVLMDLLPERPSLNQDGIVLDADTLYVMEKFSEEAHKHGAPLFIHSEKVKPMAILPLYAYNALVEKIDKRLVIDENKIYADVSVEIVKQTEREQ